MKLSALIVLGVLTCAAAPPPGTAVYIDLSGKWRMADADDPRFAAPDFDDSRWLETAVPLPHERFGPATAMIRWFRRSVDLPELARNTSLVITVGALAGSYEIHIDGALVGRRGAFNPESTLLAGPQSFSFSSGGRQRLAIAIRLYRSDVMWANAWNPRDTGPWLLTSPSAAPVEEGVRFAALMRLNRIADLLQPAMQLTFATVVLLIWARNRRQAVLLWLLFFLIASASGRLMLFTLIAPGSPIGGIGAIAPFVVMVLPAGVFGCFVASWTGQRWLYLTAAIVAAAPLTPSVAGARDLARVCCLLIVIALGAHVVRWRRDYLLAAGAVAVVYFHYVSWARIEFLPGWNLSFDTPGWFSVRITTGLMSTVAFALLMTLDQVKLLLRDRDEKARLSGELEAARRVQQLLLPAASLSSGGLQSDTVYRPAQEVGGDFYWMRWTETGALLLVTGDVSGKGLKAAMLVSVAIGMLRNEKSSSPGAILAALNDGLAGHTGGGFVTCCCARFGPDGAVTIANAGHPSPYCDGREVEVEAGLPLGVVAGVSYVESAVPGRRFTFVSDGVTEAENAQRELFGFERTREISMKSAREIAEAAKAWGQNDDITVVTVRRNGA